jgi:mRNA interferase HigB
MRIIARHTLTEFAAKNPAAAASLVHWHKVTKAAQWKTTSEVQADFSKAKVLNAERVRFAVAGGDFRLIVAFDFVRQIAFIKFLGTHAEYDRVDALNVSLF